MNSTPTDADRQVVPRWRRAFDPASIAESMPLSLRLTDVEPRRAIENADRIWADFRSNPSFHVATDLLGAAIARDDVDLVGELVNYLQPHQHAFSNALAHVVWTQVHGALDHVDRAIFTSLASGPQVASVQIATSKSLLSMNPRDGLRWMDLSWLYTFLGQRSHALRAGRVASSLLSENRYILRAASRMWLHFGDGGRALDILFRSGAVGHDPWITAAALAVGDILGNTQDTPRLAHRMIKRERFAPMHMSELRAAMSKVEADASNMKGARRLMLDALVAPTENVIAQAAWTHRNRVSLGDALDSVNGSSYEAMAWTHYYAQDLKSAYDYGVRWLQDQPFAVGAAAFVLSLATHIPAEIDSGIAYGTWVIMANPHDALLRNNLACLLALAGQISMAKQQAHGAESLAADARMMAVVRATRGLIAFCDGQYSEGDRLYRESVQMARDIGDGALARKALLYWQLRRYENGLVVSVATVPGVEVDDRVDSNDPIQAMLRHRLRATK